MGEEDKCSKQSLDYMFLLRVNSKDQVPATDSKENSVTFDVKINRTSVFSDRIYEKPYNFISDHYGVCTELTPQ